MKLEREKLKKIFGWAIVIIGLVAALIGISQWATGKSTVFDWFSKPKFVVTKTNNITLTSEEKFLIEFKNQCFNHLLNFDIDAAITSLKVAQNYDNNATLNSLMRYLEKSIFFINSNIESTSGKAWFELFNKLSEDRSFPVGELYRKRFFNKINQKGKIND